MNIDFKDFRGFTPLTGFTLLEVILVVVIIGILSTLALPQFFSTRERVLDKEAIANLKLIAAAEKIYRMEQSTYYPSSGTESAINNINSKLKLSLTGANWAYVCDTTNTRATATRSGRTWTLGYTSTGEPTCSGTGCP